MNTKKVVLGLSVLGSLFYGEKSVAQNVDVALSGDLVSSYVWRGFRNAGASVQPALSATASNFTLGAWASTDIASEGNKEINVYLNYAKSGWLFTVTNYWWDGEGFTQYFSNPGVGAGHSLETSAAYTLQKSVPLTISWNTFILGKANKSLHGNNTFSTYVEASYPFSVKNVSMKVAAGVTPWQSAIYGTYGLRVTNLLVGASKEIRLSSSFSIPIYANFIVNPSQENVHFVFGLTLR